MPATVPRSCSSRRCLAWFGFSFGSFASQPALGFGDLHPFSGAQPDQIGLALRNHPEHVEQVPSDGIGGVVNPAAEAELDDSSDYTQAELAELFGVGRSRINPTLAECDQPRRNRSDPSCT
jgi:hypothetical protein